jgi:putative SOS response-associated peptidase YedK
MCNLYSMTKGQQAIRELARAMIDRTGNLPPLPGIFPDYSAPIVRNSTDGREVAMARWGMPTPPKFLVTATGKPKASDSGVTNIRNARCLSPASPKMNSCPMAAGRRSVSHSATIGRCHSSPASGRPGLACGR